MGGIKGVRYFFWSSSFIFFAVTFCHSIAAQAYVKLFDCPCHYLLESEEIVMLAKYAQTAVRTVQHMINIST
jgi:hypothetical protein